MRDDGIPPSMWWVGLFSLFFAVVGCTPAHQQPRGAPSSEEGTPEGASGERALPALEDDSGLASTASDEALEVELVSGVWPPFTDVEGKAQISTSLVRRALELSGVTMSSATRDPNEIVAAIERGEFDGSEALWESEDRKQFLLYSKPYLENRLVVLARKGTDVSAKRLTDLKGKRLGLVESYAYGPELDAVENIEKVAFSTDEECLRALLNHNVDYVLVDELLVYHLFEHSQGKARELLVAGKQPLLLRGLHFALRKDMPEAPRVIARFNEKITEMMRSGDYHRILNVSWIALDADGDGQTEWLAASSKAGAQQPHSRYQLFGPSTTVAPRFMIEEEVYEDWGQVPDKYKVPPEPVDSFQSGITAVLLQF